MIDIIPEEVTSHYKRQCEYKRLEVLCSLLKQGDVILDVGCGIGTYTSNPLSSLPVSIIAIDSDPRTVEYADRTNRRGNLLFVCSQGETFDSNLKFDLIVCSHILEHVSNPLLLLNNVKRLLKDTGILYVAIPNGFGWLEAQNILPRILWKCSWGKSLVMKMMGGKGKDTLNVDSQHINFFTIGRIKRLLQQSGFEIVRQVNDEFLGGIVFDRILAKLPSLAKWNVKVANQLSAPLTNGWIFICRKSC